MIYDKAFLWKKPLKYKKLFSGFKDMEKFTLKEKILPIVYNNVNLNISHIYSTYIACFSSDFRHTALFILTSIPF